MALDINSQRVLFDGLLNSRDLGLMPILNGKGQFKTKVFLRMDSPSALTPSQVKSLKDYGVDTVIDLRSAAEVEYYGNPFIEDSDVLFANIPLFVGNPDDENDATMNMLRTHTLGDFYVLLIEELGPRVKEVFELIFARLEKASQDPSKDHIIAFHCAHGKDRTGVVAAMLYLIAGASREDIIANYACSYGFLKPMLDPLIEKKETCLKHTLRSDAHNMETFLNHVDSKYGGKIETYFDMIGFDKEKIEYIRKSVTVTN